MTDSDAVPNEAADAFARGLTCGAGGDPAGASAMFARALVIAPEFHDARFNLAKSLKDQGRNAEAELEYRRYLLNRPDDATALYNLANILALSDRLDEAARLFRKLIGATPHFHDARTNLALVEERRGNSTVALDLLEEVLDAAPDHAHANHLRRSILSRIVPHWHFTMLNDQERNDAYEQAIARAVNGRNVLEIGAGSGLLAMMAARHGANRVTACEMSEPLAKTAQRIVARNNLSDRVSIVPKKSMQLEVGRDLPSRADVLIAEVFDVGLLGEGFVPALVHARADLMIENPVLVPARAIVHGMLIECPELWNVHPIGRISGFDLSDFNMFRKIGYEPLDMTNVPYIALTEPFVVSDLDFATLGLETAATTHDLAVVQGGTCHAVMFWFDLVFSEGSSFSSFPDRSTSHWKQAVQFFDADRQFAVGETVQVKTVRDPNGFSFTLL